jgi:hypothetical protein
MGMKRVDLMSQLVITQIGSNLRAETSFSCGVSFDMHNSAKQMKDKCSKSHAKPKGQVSMITKTQVVHLVRVRDTPVVLSHNGRARDEHGNTCVY